MTWGKAGPPGVMQTWSQGQHLGAARQQALDGRRKWQGCGEVCHHICVDGGGWTGGKISIAGRGRGDGVACGAGPNDASPDAPPCGATPEGILAVESGNRAERDRVMSVYLDVRDRGQRAVRR